MERELGSCDCTVPQRSTRSAMTHSSNRNLRSGNENEKFKGDISKGIIHGAKIKGGGGEEEKRKREIIK